MTDDQSPPRWQRGLDVVLILVLVAYASAWLVQFVLDLIRAWEGQ